MHITRQHHVVVLHLGAPSAEVDSLVDASLPIDDEFHFRSAETGFPDHGISFHIHSLACIPQQPHQISSSGNDLWLKPSEFRRSCVGAAVGNNSNRLTSASKENLPPHPSPNTTSSTYASEASVHCALRLHQIFDGLPSTLGGETLLTILWPAFDDSVIPEDHVELFGALKRARDWFDARLAICVGEDEGEAAGNDAASVWEALLDARVLTASRFSRQVIFDARTIWVGVAGDGKESYRLSVADENHIAKSKEKSKARLSGGGKPTEATDADLPVRLLVSHSLKLKKVLSSRKVPLHRMSSEPVFYLTSLSSMVEDTAHSSTNQLQRLFPSTSLNSSDCALVTLEFAIDGKAAPTNKDNGAGRRPWDKLSASTSGSTNGEEEFQMLSPHEFVFNRPHLTTTWKEVRDRRSIDFIVSASDSKESLPYLKMFRLRQDLEIHSCVFDTSKTIAEASQMPDENFLQAFDRLPCLSSSKMFAQCIEKSANGESIDTFLLDLERKGVSPVLASDIPSPLDMMHLESEIVNHNLALDASTLLREGENSEHVGVDGAQSSGGLLGDVAALVRADVQDDPFNRKVRAEDILAKCQKRFNELFDEGMGGKRQRQSSFEGANIAAIPWPDVKEIQWHDVYYNRGSESEEKAQEIHILKVS